MINCWFLCFLSPLYFLTSVLSLSSDGELFAWDIQTGVLVKELHTSHLNWYRPYGHREMCGFVSRVCAFLRDETLHTIAACEDEGISLGPHWLHEGSLRFATTLKTGPGLAISIREFRPTSTPLHPVIELFHVPYYEGIFSFSPDFFHASFVAPTKVVILDVRESNILLHSEAAQESYECSSGSFSPDGRFFACKILWRDIRVWKKTPTGYIPWSTVRPRLPCKDFSFSPTATSILTWGPDGIQLLRPEDRVSSSTSNPIEPDPRRENHLVTSSTDGAWIATTRRGGCIITILDSFSGNPQHSIDVGSEIRDMRFVRNTIMVVGDHMLVGWDLGTDGPTEVVAHAGILAGLGLLDHFTLSNDGAHIACVKYEETPVDIDDLGFYADCELLLYHAESRQIVSSFPELRRRDGIDGVRFSPRGSTLWFWSMPHDDRLPNPIVFDLDGCSTRVEIEEGRFVYVPGGTTYPDLRNGWLSFAFHHSRDGFHIRHGGRWVEDSGGRKLFWVPPNWRVRNVGNMIWEGNLLALVNSGHEEPIIVQFQP